MKFKKLDTKSFADTSFNHYTEVKNIPSIAKNGVNNSGGDADRLSGFLNEHDFIKNDQVNFKKFYNTKRGGKYKRDHGLGNNPFHVDNTMSGLFLDTDPYMKSYNPKNKYNAQVSTIDNLWSGLDRESTIPESAAPVRLAKPMNNFKFRKSSGKYVSQNPDGTEFVVNRLAGTDYNESTTSTDDSSKRDFKIQLPFGAVTKNNAKVYEQNLKYIDPSKFDVNDTYTRRLYNNWAKKNNKPLLPGSDKYIFKK